MDQSILISCVLALRGDVCSKNDKNHFMLCKHNFMFACNKVFSTPAVEKV